MSRKCDGCTKCCDGWLTGQAHGHGFWPGRPCHFVGVNKCSIYKDRPEDPCRTFVCEWLVNPDVPEWMKPNVMDVIIAKKEKNGVPYWQISEAGSKLKIEVLSWLMMHCLKNSINFAYSIGTGSYRFGSQEFLNEFEKN